MDLVHMATCSIHWANTVEYWIQQNCSAVEFVWIWYTCIHALYWAVLWSTWIQQKQPVEFDGFVHMATCYYLHVHILWCTESNKSSRWSLMDLIHMATMLLFNGLYCGCTWIQQCTSNMSRGYIYMDMVQCTGFKPVLKHTCANESLHHRYINTNLVATQVNLGIIGAISTCINQINEHPQSSVWCFLCIFREKKVVLKWSKESTKENQEYIL